MLPYDGESPLKTAFEGKLSLHYKTNQSQPSFGFVDECYVPSELLKASGIENECKVTVFAIRTITKKDSFSWRAYAIKCI